MTVKDSLKSYIKDFFKLKNMPVMIRIYILFFLFFLLSDSLDVFIPLYFKQQGKSVVGYGALQSVTTILRIIAVNSIAGPRNRMKKQILLFVMLLNVVNIAAFTFVQSMLLFYLVFGLLMVTRSIFNAVLNPALAKSLPETYLGMGFGVRDVFLNLGSAVGLFISGFLTSRFQSEAMFLFIGICCVLLVISILRLKRELSPASLPDLMDEKAGLPAKAQETFLKLPKRLQINFITVCVIGVCISLGTSVQSYMPYIGADMGFQESSVYYLFSSSVVITALFSVAGGVIIDKCNKKALYFVYVIICLLCVLLLLFPFKAAFIGSLFLLSIRGVLDNIEQTYFFDYFRGYHIDSLWARNATVLMLTGAAAPALTGVVMAYSQTLTAGISLGLLLLAFLACLNLRSVHRH